MYRPLPDFVTIQNSPIEGMGLFATKDLPAGFNIGITHVEHPEFEHNYIRTPLGGFYNHSETPNCETAGHKIRHLTTLRPIKSGEELTVKYRLYNPTKENDITEIKNTLHIVG